LNAHDRGLGMSRNITRRDFVNCVSVGAAGAALLPQWVLAQEFAPEQSPDYYPPGRTGMRGDHPGSFEVAHQLRDSRKVDLSSVTHTNETYDLVIVGGGISGLGAAYYFLTNAGRSARVLNSRQSRRFRRPCQAQRVPAQRAPARHQRRYAEHRGSAAV
jgi:spermidine dehydrogenase